MSELEYLRELLSDESLKLSKVLELVSVTELEREVGESNESLRELVSMLKREKLRMLRNKRPKRHELRVRRVCT